MKWSTLITPPAPRPPPPKHPLFTTKFLSTKSFGPGHIVGAGILVFGIVGLSKLFVVARGQAQTDGARRLARSSRSENDPMLSENERGQYGKK